MKFPQNLRSRGRGDLRPCCYDFEWPEITARGDRRPNLLLLWFQDNSDNSKWKWNVSGKLYLPTLGLFWYEKYYSLNIFLTPKRGDIIFHKHFIFACCYLSYLKIIIVRNLVFGLPLLLFHFIQNRNSKGTGGLRSPLAVISLHSKS